MTEFHDREEVAVIEGEQDGDSFKKVARVEAVDDQGEEFEFVALKSGQMREATTKDGETVLVETVEESKSLTSPGYITDLAGALATLGDRIE